MSVKNIVFPGQPPGNHGNIRIGMMQGMPQQYIQPGMQRFPMMQQNMMAPPGPMMQQQQMFHMQQQMRMRPPVGMAPPPYTQRHADNYRQRFAVPHSGQPSKKKPNENDKKGKLFHEQQQKLKLMGNKGAVDVSRMIESMFGATEKPKPKSPVCEDLSSDSFGDFMGGPTVMSAIPKGDNQKSEATPNMVLLANENSTQNRQSNTDTSIESQKTSTNIQKSPGTENEKTTEKKDLVSMMFECSDLSASNKAKTFHKPSLKEIHPIHNVPQHYPVTAVHESEQARHWNQETQDLSGLFLLDEQQVHRMHLMEQARMAAVSQKRRRKSSGSRHDPLKYELPHWCNDDEKVPEVYKQVLEASLVDGKISTERLYPILLMSGLPKESLGQIWSLSNKATLGQLIKPELYLMLALIAFAQNNYTSLSVEVLHKCPHPPVPYLGQPPQGSQTPTSSQQPVTQVLPDSEQPPVSVVSGGANTFQGTPISEGSSIQPGQFPVPLPTVSPLMASGQHLIGMAPQVPISGQMPPATGQIPPSPALISSTQPTATGQQDNSQAPGILPVSHSSAFPVSQNPISSVPQTSTQAPVVSAGVSMDTDDDFADFQAAAASVENEDEFGDFHVTPVPKSSEIEYVYKIPRPSVDKLDEYSAQDYEHSNVRNFFGSDDSSGASTPNSLDDDYDDFKSADSKPSDSSQFTSSNSETEDFRMFESYLDDFSKKRNELDKDDSPLHRPVSKSSHITHIPPSAPPPSAIPAVRNLWPKGQVTLPNLKSDTKVSRSVPTHALPGPSSDNDFADFQQATNSDVQGKDAVGTDVLIGDEDKYAALRSMVFTSEPLESSVNSKDADEGDNWAVFQSVDQTGENTSDLNKSTSDSNDFTGFQTAATGNESSDWSAFSSSADNPQNKLDLFKNTTDVSKGMSQQSNAILEENKEDDDDEDDWSNFQGSSQNTDNTMSSLKQDVSDSNDSSIVFVRKENLQKTEILNLFQVKSEPLFPVSNMNKDVENITRERESSSDKNIPVSLSNDNLQIPSSSSDHHISSNRSSVSSQDFSKQKSPIRMSDSDGDFDDPFRAPPPMDYTHEEEDDFGAFSRGYDIEDIVHPKPPDDKKNKVYNYYGMEFTAPSNGENKDKSEHKKSEKVTLSSTQNEKEFGNNLNGNDLASESSVTKEPGSVNWSLKVEKSEDTQSISSLELSFNKSRVRDLHDGDNQSVSSNEFGNYENVIKTTINPESKSIDSLDLQRGDTSDEANSDQVDEDAGKSSGETTQNPESETTIGTNTNFTNISPLTPQTGLPVLGDRYSEILHDIPGSDKHAYEWQRCLEHCFKMIKDANNVFNSISSSAVCNEVIKSEQGTEYVQGIVEIYRVSCRITLAMISSGLATDKLKQILRDVDLSWNNLTAFLVGGNLMPEDNSLDFSNALLKSDDTTSQMKACGVCLLNVDTRPKNLNQDEDCAKLTYGGRQYHSACANFWLNCVDSMLPALKLPELL